MRRASALAALFLTAFAGTAQAQGYGRGGTPGEFDFYVLALSWSPTYCETAGRRDADGQCRPGRGLGFVVHGLWPQYTRGYPSDCSSVERSPTRQAMDVAGEVFRARGWPATNGAKHGTCSGLDPMSYFKATAQARQAVTIPAAFAKPDSDTRIAPVDIARQFVAANRGLRPDMMSVTCTRGELQEVRVCFTKDLRGFTPLPRSGAAELPCGRDRRRREPVRPGTCAHELQARLPRRHFARRAQAPRADARAPSSPGQAHGLSRHRHPCGPRFLRPDRRRGRADRRVA